ncbi:type I restriction-modification system subunit M [Mycoplasmopsis edwardii]|nr:type I restriction-modification system subunit M [Mycoplasmopsis edwardii]
MNENIEKNKEFRKISKQELSNKVWAAANQLRSELDATEYDKIILGLIFYKFLSSKQEEILLDKNDDFCLYEKGEEIIYKDQPVVYIEDLDNKSHPNLIESIKDRLKYFIPYKYLFSTWNKKEYKNIFDRNYIIDSINNFNSVIRELSEKDAILYKNIFNEFYSSIQKIKKEDTLKKVVKIIDEIPTKKQDYDVLGFIYQYLIGMFASSAGKKAGEFYTPIEASILMSEIISHHLSQLKHNNNVPLRIYDPTAGSGSLLIRVAEKFQKHMDEIQKDISIKYIAQEIKSTSFNTLRMNLIMHNIDPELILIRQADTLEDDWPANTHDDRRVKAIVANPPYSQPWKPENKNNDPRFMSYGLAPKSKADYAFLLHSLYHLDNDGIMAIVLPHGVLFRGGSELEIRKTLVEKQKIDTIIGLPNNMFMGTGISTIIMILKENKKTDDFMFVDASKLFSKDGNKNKLDKSHIIKMADIVNNRIEKEGFSRIVSIDEIRNNEYNLNISRYIDNFEKEDIFDLYSTMYGGVSEQELSSLNKYWNKFKNVKEKIMSKRNDGYYLLNKKEEELRKEILNDFDVIKFINDNKSIGNEIKNVFKNNIGSFDEIKITNIFDFENNLEKYILKKDDDDFIEKYDIYQIAIEKFEELKQDIDILKNYMRDNISFEEIKNEEKLEIKDKNSNVKEWDARILNKNIIIENYFKRELNLISESKEKIEFIENEIKDIFESIDDEEKDIPVFKENGFDTKELSKIVTTLSKKPNLIENKNLSEKLILAHEKYNEMVRVKNNLKIMEDSLIKNSLERYNSLNKEEFYQLLFYKWTHEIAEKLVNNANKEMEIFIEKIEHLFNKYNDTLNEINTEIEKNENELKNLLSELNGDEYDKKALDELIKILGGIKNE